MNLLRSSVVALLCATACKSGPAPIEKTTTEEKLPQPRSSEASSVPAPVEPPPASPALVELPPARPLPKVLAGGLEPQAPVDNPVTPEKAELGWFLFFDARMSKDGSMACVQCHHIDKAYTSGTQTDAKVGGALNKRNSPTVVGLGFHSSWYWDGRMPTLEAVSAAAWKGQLGADPAIVAQKLNVIGAYRAMFVRAFNEPATPENVPKALATFFRTLNTGSSAFDKDAAGDKAALSPDAKSGRALFLKGGCASCHVPPLFSDFAFHAVGLGDDPGRMDSTKSESDRGLFKTPTLRNVARTAPYFHDGSAKTLEEAITVMAQGGNVKGVVKPDPLLKALSWTPKQVSQVRAFLESLSGELTYNEPPKLP
jgi:cytochrome c peroxidase